MASITDESFLGTGLGWLAAIVGAVLLALLAYVFYAVAVVIFAGSIGFALGTSVMVALDVSWAWGIVLVGVALGGLLAWAAIATDLPGLLLVVLSALGGASAIAGGIMVLTGAIDSVEFSEDAVTARVDGELWWTLLYLALAVSGVVAQLRAADRARGSMRDAWA